jgi:hypothetical protein
MSDFAEKRHEWETDIAVALYRIIEPEDEREPSIEADEVCFFGALATLPESLSAFKGIASPAQKPEVYVVAMKDGELIPPEIWLAPSLADRLETSGIWLQEKMGELRDLHLAARKDYPAVIKAAVVVETGQAVMIQEFGELADPPHPSMTAADWAFDQWVARISELGSAFADLDD